MHRDRPDLGQVLPHHMERPTANYRLVAGALGNPELLDVFVERDGGLAQQPAGPAIAPTRAGYRADIVGAPPPDLVAHGSHTLTGASGRGPGWAAQAGSRTEGIQHVRLGAGGWARPVGARECNVHKSRA